MPLALCVWYLPTTEEKGGGGWCTCGSWCAAQEFESRGVAVAYVVFLCLEEGVGQVNGPLRDVGFLEENFVLRGREVVFLHVGSSLDWTGSQRHQQRLSV